MTKHSSFLTLLVLIACSTQPIPSQDAAAPSPTAVIIEAPPVAFTPTPMPDWLVAPRAPLGWPEHEAPPVRAPVRKPTMALGVARPPIIPSSWTVPAWVIDPVNGNDNNTCVTNGSACKTYAEVAARWGTYSPRLRQNTTLTWLTSQPDNTDPVYFTPYVENDSLVQIIGTLTQVASVSLASVTAKNRNAPQLLQADLGASGAADQFLINTTTGGRAWVYKVVAGTVFAISQPMAAVTPPFSATGTEDNAWANTNTVTLNTPTTVDLQAVAPRDGQNATSNKLVYILNVKTISLGGFGSFYTNGGVRAVECSFYAPVLLAEPLTPVVFKAGMFNSETRTGVSTEPVTGPSAFQITAGITSNLIGAIAIDQDLILTQNASYTAFGTGVNNNNTNIGLFYLETGASLIANSARVFIGNAGGGAPVIWGPGTVKVIGSSHLTYPTGGVATTTFLQTGGLQINALTTACSSSGANNPDVISCGIILNPTNLDAAQGLTGFGGNAFVMGGGSISTF